MKPLNSDFEKFLSEALELHEKGKPLVDILAKFPNRQRQLKEIFDIVDLVKRQKDAVAPPKAVLSKILASLPVGTLAKQKAVTKKQTDRYLFRGGQKGRPSFPQVINLISMWKNWKLLLPLGAAAVIVLILVSVQLTSRQPSITDLAVVDQEQANLDDLDVLVEEYLDEEMVISEDVDSNLDEAAANETVAPVPEAPSVKVAGDPLESAAIQSEAQAIAFDADLDSFLVEEASLKEIDSSLTDF